MIGIAIRFDLGRYHANPWGSHVNDAATEWPPSPWRLIRALYSTARTNASLADQRDAVDRALQALIDAPLPSFVLPPSISAHTRHYMPATSYSPMRPGDTSKVLDGFLAVDPESELTAWWDVALDAEAADALSKTVRCLGYLGRSESVCSARLVTSAPPEHVSAAPAETIEMQDDGWELTDLLCPQREMSLDQIAVSVAELRKSRRLVPPGTHRVTYAVARPDLASSPIQHRAKGYTPTLALLHLRGSARPAITEAVAVGQALRSALQNVFGTRNDGGASPTFSGRQGDIPRDDQHRHAHYLAIADGEGPRIDRLVVWAPEGFQPAEIEALAGVSYLSMHDVPERMPTALAALATETTLDLPPITGTAREWASITPFGLVRHPKMRGGELRDSPEEQVQQELSRRGLPQAEEITFERGSWHRFRSHKRDQARLQRTSVFGVRLRFADPVPGPIAIGAFSHFGLGLFKQVS